MLTKLKQFLGFNSTSDVKEEVPETTVSADENILFTDTPHSKEEFGNRKAQLLEYIQTDDTKPITFHYFLDAAGILFAPSTLLGFEHVPVNYNTQNQQRPKFPIENVSHLFERTLKVQKNDIKVVRIRAIKDLLSVPDLALIPYPALEELKSIAKYLAGLKDPYIRHDTRVFGNLFSNEETKGGFAKDCFIDYDPMLVVEGSIVEYASKIDHEVSNLVRDICNTVIPGFEYFKSRSNKETKMCVVLGADVTTGDGRGKCLTPDEYVAVIETDISNWVENGLGGPDLFYVRNRLVYGCLNPEAKLVKLKDILKRPEVPIPTNWDRYGNKRYCEDKAVAYKNSLEEYGLDKIESVLEEIICEQAHSNEDAKRTVAVWLNNSPHGKNCINTIDDIVNTVVFLLGGETSEMQSLIRFEGWRKVGEYLVWPKGTTSVPIKLRTDNKEIGSIHLYPSDNEVDGAVDQFFRIKNELSTRFMVLNPGTDDVEYYSTTWMTKCQVLDIAHKLDDPKVRARYENIKVPREAVENNVDYKDHVLVNYLDPMDGKFSEEGSYCHILEPKSMVITNRVRFILGDLSYFPLPTHTKLFNKEEMDTLLKLTSIVKGDNLK